eukprot:TRINITY_DN10370_c0_g1_i2.p1 TRINITY_DN10370_c0_g1~~TRINITY_DN10370_c0_g1_i2.p1  ORF type:complete len:689 (+),score=258.59 TRINITY_DN10370_c0_g1_i2:110-2068(+)
MALDAAMQAAASRMHAEAKEFAAFFVSTTGKLAAADPQGRSVAAWYERRNALCVALGEARHRMLAAWGELDRLLGEEVAAYKIDVMNILRKDHHRACLSVGQLQSSPVVALLGYHDLEKKALMETILNLGGAYSHVCSRNTVTHVVANPAALSERRGLAMRSWDMPLVAKEWLTASEGEHRFVDHTPYLHDLTHVRSSQIPAAHRPSATPRRAGVVAGAPSTPGAVFATPGDCSPPPPPASGLPLTSGSRRAGTPAPGEMLTAGGGEGMQYVDDSTDTAYGAAPRLPTQVTPAGDPLPPVMTEQDEGSLAFLQEVEQLCAVQDSFGEEAAPAEDGGENPYLAAAAAAGRRSRISRKEVFDNDDAPPAKRHKDAPRPGTAGGTANTREVVGEGDSSRERLPPEVPQGLLPPHPKLPATGGVESQKVRWDATSTPHRKSSLRQQATKRLFQMAGGGGVTRQVREALVRKIKDLGGEVELVPKYVARSSHLLTLCATQQLTEKYLSFVASGKWIVTEAYITDSHEAGYWLEERDYTDDGPNNTIGHHRVSHGGTFKAWKVILLMEPGGIHVILRAGGCTQIWNEITEENCREATHVLSDTPGKELTLPTPKGADPALLAALGAKVFSIEILYRILCVSIEEQEARQNCSLSVTFT